MSYNCVKISSKRLFVIAFSQQNI